MWRKVKQEKEETASKPLSSKGSDARESKGTPAKAWVSKGNPEQAPESFARSLCSLASLAPRNNNTQKNQAQQATLNKNIPQQPKVTKNSKNNQKLAKGIEKISGQPKNLPKQLK